MSSNNFLAASTISNIGDLKEQLAAVKNSRLSDADKQKVELAYKKAIRITIGFTIISIISLVSLVLVLSFLDFGVASALIPIGLFIVETIIFAVIIHNMLKKARTLIQIVSKGFDGRTQAEIQYLKPNLVEQKMISNCKRKKLFWVSMFLISVFGVTAVILLFRHWLPCIIPFIICFIVYMRYNDWQIEQRRLESGYYKKMRDYYCKNCGQNNPILFSDLERQAQMMYVDETNRWYAYCSHCHSNMEFFGIDADIKDYHKYCMEYWKIAKRSGW